MFELDKISVHAIVAKMIISEELMASMDEPTECMVMHRTEPSSKTFLLFLFPPKIWIFHSGPEKKRTDQKNLISNNYKRGDTRYLALKKHLKI